MAIPKAKSIDLRREEMRVERRGFIRSMIEQSGGIFWTARLGRGLKEYPIVIRFRRDRLGQQGLVGSVFHRIPLNLTDP